MGCRSRGVPSQQHREGMTAFEVVTLIDALPQRCFDLARDVDFHARSLALTDERVVDRPSRRLLEFGDEVEFEGRHFGVRQRLRARIDRFDEPRLFRDVAVRSAFHLFEHEHHFEPLGCSTRMVDRVRFAAPFGPVGWVVERAVLRPYLKRLIALRGQAIKHEAER